MGRMIKNDCCTEPLNGFTATQTIPEIRYRGVHFP